MNAVGIIAEYNPLHNGHLYHIAEARKIAGSGAVVVAMSGDYVQRGEPAILNKWERTRLALLNGADLVVEIPTLFCLGNAGQYAKAGVYLLESMPLVTHIAFGSETGDTEGLETAAFNLDRAGKDLDKGIARYVKEGMSFPAARARAYKDVFPRADELPDSPNDVLALEYIRATNKLEHIAIKRVGAAYNDSNADEVYMSASGIRQAVKSYESVQEFVPPGTMLSLKESNITFPDKWIEPLKFAILSMSPEEIDRCPSGGEGLGNRVKAAINQADDWNGLVEAVKSKRYTHTRISRLFMQILLGIKRDDFVSDRPGYIRILGITETGKELLSKMKKDEDLPLPFITNINKQINKLDDDARKQLELDIHGVDVYNFVTGRDHHRCSDYKMKPIIISEEKS